MTDKIIGSGYARCLVAICAGLATVWVSTSGGVVRAWDDLATWHLMVWGVVTFGAIVLSSRRLYDRWEPIAERINAVMIRLIFGFVYFVVVPPFALWSKLARLRDAAETHSYWVPRPEPESPAELFDRMD